MADKEIDIKINTIITKSGGENSLEGIRKSIKALKSEALSIGDAGKGFVQLNQKATELQDKLDDLGDSAKTLKGSGIEKLTGSFGLLKESFANFDIDKAKIGFQGLGSAMSAIPIFLVIQGVMELLKTFDIFGKITEGITDIIYGFTDALGLTNKATEEKTKNSLEGLSKEQKAVEERYDAEINEARAAGKETGYLEIEKLKATEKGTEEQIKVLELASIKKGGLNEEEQKQYEELQTNLLKASSDRRAKELEEEQKFRQKMSEFSSFQDDIDTQYKIAKMSEREKQIFLIQQNAQKQLKELQDKEVVNFKASGKQIEAQYERVEKTKKEILAIAQIEIAKINKEFSDKELEKRLKEAKEVEDRKRKIAQEGYDALSTVYGKMTLPEIEEPGPIQLKPLINFKNKIKEEFEKAYSPIAEGSQMAYDKWKKSFDGIAEQAKLMSAKVNQYTQAIGSTLNSVVGVFDAITELNKQRREQELQASEDEMNAKISNFEEQKDYELSKEGLTGEQKDAINKKYALQEYALRLDQYKKETEVKKKAFEQDKKMKVATTIISTITGAVAAFTGMVQSIPGPIGLILGAVSAAAVVAMGAINIAKIKEQKFDAGTPPSPPKANLGAGSTNIGSNQSEATMNAPSLRKIGRSRFGAEGQETEVDETSYKRGGQTIRAYVVSDDITNAQDKDAIIKRRMSF